MGSHPSHPSHRSTALCFTLCCVTGQSQPGFLTGPEVCQLLVIAKSTLGPWRRDGHLVAHQLPNGQYRYPVDQPTIRGALDALAGCPAVPV